jgi:tripartite-type tricarboxylate transporter receptor subunit TctC
MLCVLAGSAALAADEYPSKPIKLVVPSAAGGTPDTLLRTLTAEVSKSLGQTFVIENKPGGAGMIGMSEIERAPADGYTLTYANNVTLAINKSTYKKLPYNPDGLTPVVFLFKVANILSANTNVPVKTYAELLAYIKAHPGKLTFASPGQGTSGHLTGELLAEKAGLQLTHVPYKGSPQAVTDVLGGQVDLMIDNTPTMLPYIHQGKLRPLAVTSAARLPQLPDVPTIAEAGIPGFEGVAWGGLVAPPGIPAAVVEKLNTAFNKALAAPAVQERFRALGVIAVGGKPTELSDFARKETVKWAAVVKQAGIEPQ